MLKIRKISGNRGGGHLRHRQGARRVERIECAPTGAVAAPEARVGRNAGHGRQPAGRVALEVGLREVGHREDDGAVVAPLPVLHAPARRDQQVDPPARPAREAAQVIASRRSESSLAELNLEREQEEEGLALRVAASSPAIATLAMRREAPALTLAAPATRIAASSLAMAAFAMNGEAPAMLIAALAMAMAELATPMAAPVMLMAAPAKLMAAPSSTIATTPRL